MPYKVVKGDTLGRIAKANDTTVEELMKLNPSIKNANLILVGQDIVLPDESPDGGNGDIKAPDEELGPLALPRGASLIRVGSDYRVLWDLPDDMGTVWYTISTAQLTQIYGDNWEGDVREVYSNTGSFEAKYGNLAWGNVAEIPRTSEDPWQDMYQRILNTFGFVAGMENSEVRRLVIQAYFEKWTSSEFLALYKQTDYFNSTTDLQRKWVITSDAEKDRLTREKASDLVSKYYGFYGEDPVGGLENPDILSAARAIASGAMSEGEWIYDTKKKAQLDEGSPAYRDLIDERQAKGEQESSTENLGAFAEGEWRRWMGGAVPIPSDFASDWGNWLYLNRRSEADLDTYLKGLSSTYYPDKDSNTSWADWAAIPRSYIQNLLELPTVADNDGLLDQILQSGATGYDMRVLIKNDPRYMQTKGAFSELSSKVSNLGTMMGFIPGGSI